MSDFSVTTSTPKETPSVKEIGISGPMTIQHAGEIRTVLLEALTEAEEVRMEMAQVTEIDVVGLQLLCSAHRTSAGLNKRFTLGGCNETSVTEAMRMSGFARHVGCVQDINHTCLWLGGKK
ncbi:MAG: STAS domain-containing protein [Desulfobacteraceae bacterium]|nr:STAS domain-containing protein [Desulfobacteraceae bacterium]